MGQPPNIIAHQGTVEDWVIENRALQDHVFHIHQIHFKVLEINGEPVPDSGLRDTIDIPYYDEKGPYPSVRLRMDFRDPKILGTFVFHCHILQHQDQGMMGTIHVAPPGRPTSISMEASEHNVTLYDVFSITTKLLNADAKAAKGSVQFVVDDSQTSKAALANGEARFTGRISKPGKHVITAIYLGDTNLAPSPSTSLSVNVVSSFFTLSPSPDLELKLPSHSASSPLTVNAVGGFNQPVQLGCALPKELKGASCSVIPSVINGSGTAMLTIANEGDVASTEGANRGTLGLPRGNYPITFLRSAEVAMWKSEKHSL
jgi:Multicopper oxidase/Bacterial Ig-like domain (group 3)